MADQVLRTQADIDNFALESALDSLAENTSVEYWANSVGISLYANQIKILEAMADPTIKDLGVLAARASGKTYAIALGMIKMCLDGGERYQILLFGPAADQAKRILGDEIEPMCRANAKLNAEVKWDACNAHEFVFKNGAKIYALSASKGARIVGYHAPVLIIDEAQLVDDTVFKRDLVPMTGGFDNKKIIKIGVALFNNNFRESFSNPKTHKIVFPWQQCPKLFTGEKVNIDGVEYSRDGIIDPMPLCYKKEYWPHRPDLHYDSTQGLTKEEWKTQYEVQWSDSISPFFTEEEKAVVLSGAHEPLTQGKPGEDYCAGVDIAGGGLIFKDQERDSTIVCTVRKNSDGTKDVVDFSEVDPKDIPTQEKDIDDICTNRFSCSYIGGDYSNMGIGLIDLMKNNQRPMIGIKFRATENSTGKNYKNYIFDHLINEVRHGRVKFPAAGLIENHGIFQKAIDEMDKLERVLERGVNAEIKASLGGHDDTMMALAMAVAVCDRFQEEKDKIRFKNTNFSFPRLVVGGTTTQARTSFQSGARNMTKSPLFPKAK